MSKTFRRDRPFKPKGKDFKKFKKSNKFKKWNDKPHQLHQNPPPPDSGSDDLGDE